MWGSSTEMPSKDHLSYQSTFKVCLSLGLNALLIVIIKSWKCQIFLSVFTAL